MKVRIAVAIDARGNWTATGWQGQSDDDLRGMALDGLDPSDDPNHVVFVEAEVPLPEIKTVKGRVA